MRRLIPIVLVLLTCLSVLIPASASHLGEAKSPVWCGGEIFLDTKTGEVVDLRTDEVLLRWGNELLWDGESRLVFTKDEWWRVADDGTLVRLAWHPDDDAFIDDCRWGVVLADTRAGTAVYRAAGAELLTVIPSWAVRICHDAETGGTYILACDGSFIRSDGTVMAEGYDAFEFNAEWDLVTCGMVCGYRDHWEEPEEAEAVVLDLRTGAEIASFRGCWNTFDGSAEIYSDGTAVLTDPLRIVRLTGEVLLDLSDADCLYDRTENEGYYRFERDGREFLFFPETGEQSEAVRDGEGRLIGRMDPQTGAVLTEGLQPAGPRLEQVSADETGTGRYGYRILGVDGKPLSEEIWSEVLRYSYNLDGIGMLELFWPTGSVPVVSAEGKLGVLGSDGSMILPAVFDYENYDSCTPVKDEGYLVRRDGEWQIFDLDGNRLY